MAVPAGFDWGGRFAEDLLLTAATVALVSGACWLIARLLPRKAALRHQVLLAGLVCCVACPLAVALGKLVRTATSGATAGGPASCVPTCNRSAIDCDSAAERPTAVAAVGDGRDDRRPVKIVAVATTSWAAGTTLLLLRLAWNAALVVRLRRSARPTRCRRLSRTLAEVAERLGLRTTPMLLVSNRTAVPLAVGLGHPAVVLPKGLCASIGRDELYDILMHELAHLRRKDQWIVLLQDLVGALHWPVVTVHGLNRELRRSREQVCDNAVLQHRDPVAYGRTLLRVAEMLTTGRPPRAAVGLAGSRGELERRITALVDGRRDPATTVGRPTACALALAAVVVACLPAATRFVRPAATAEPAAPTGSAVESAQILETTPSAAGEVAQRQFAFGCCPS